MEHRFSAGIVGGGPAGAALAIRLRRLGHDVVIVTDGRHRYGVQGLSERASEGLHALGATEAKQTLRGRSPRLVLWNGYEASPNYEHLIDRREFDTALLRDAVESGVRVHFGSVRMTTLPAVGQIEMQHRESGIAHVIADFWIDARGRAAIHESAAAIVGPQSLAVQQEFHSPARQPCSSIVSLEDGWCWVAVLGNGRGVLQRVVRGGHGRLAGIQRKNLIAQLAARHACFGKVLSNAQRVGPLHAYPTAATLSAAHRGALRVGDALLAPDPLSGHGVYEALSNSINVAAAVNTCLRAPHNAGLAYRFVAERARERYALLDQIGLRAYRQEHRWRESPFWSERQQTDRTASAAGVLEATIVHDAPVFERDLVVAANVLVTPGHPRGVWRVHDVPVVELLTHLREGRGLDAAARSLHVPLDHAARAAQWLSTEGMFGDAQL